VLCFEPSVSLHLLKLDRSQKLWIYHTCIWTVAMFWQQTFTILQKRYYLCIRHRKRRRRYNCKQFHHIWCTTSWNYNNRYDRFVIDKNWFFVLSREWHPRCRHCRRFKNVTGVSRNKYFLLQKDSAFQFPIPYMAYFIALQYFISNRTQIHWNCFFVNSCTTFAGVACIKRMKIFTSLFELANGIWSIA